MPVVSVFCITYNHVNFIRDAIEGFLMQETTFPVEIFIHDDASTDGTAEIVKEYAEKYPKLFWTILQTENQWSKGEVNLYFAKLMQKQRGEFIALCEGDDYWIAKEKLQKQVKVLEQESSFVGCCHDVFTNLPYSKTGLLYDSYFALNGGGANITLEHLLSSNWMATCSVLIRRKNLMDLPEFSSRYVMGDWCMWIWAARKGDFFIDSKALGFYRAHDGGVWNSRNRDSQLVEIIKMLSGISKIIENRYEEAGVDGLLSYYSQFFMPAFLGMKVNEFKLAKRLIKSSSWNQEIFLKKMGTKIQEQQFLGEVGCGVKGIVDLYEICFYIKKSLQSYGVASQENCEKLAKSVASSAWVNKTRRPFFALGTFLLAILISLNGTRKALHQMLGISLGNFCRATANE